MTNYYYNLLPKLIPFVFEKHYHNHFINIEWVLINGLANKKVVYVFKPDHSLDIIENAKITQTHWQHITTNFFSIQTEDGRQVVSLHYKDTDVLVINKKGTDDYAFFVDESSYKHTLNTKADLQKFLLDKYLKKAKTLIKEHQFYYIQNFEEHGPFTVTELSIRVKNKVTDVRCFVRDINESNYDNRIRIADLLKEL